MHALLWAEAAIRSRFPRDDRGEGVISTAIAVLIIASIGALMWFGLRAMWEDTEANTNDQIDQIGG